MITSKVRVGLLLGVLAGCAATQDAATSDEELNESKALGMTDVTILYPLPKNIDFFDDLLGPSSEDAQGELCPAEIFTSLGELPTPPMMAADGTITDPKTTLFAPWKDSFSLLRVIGIRLDPCFGETFDLDSAACTNTIRLTAQFFTPRTVAPDGRAAIHLFYKVTRKDFTDIAKAMLALRRTTGLPLQKGIIGTTKGVHPTLVEEGPRGPYATALKALVLKYAGERTLTRVAFAIEDRAQAQGTYNNAAIDSRWVYGGFEYGGGALKPLPISTLDYTGQQSVDAVATARGSREAVVVTPPITVTDNYMQAFNRKPEPNGQLDQAKMESARQASITIQNPTKYTTKNADCVSCHMAKQAYPNHPIGNFDFKSATFRLDHTDDRVGPFRLFGYDGGGNPIIAGRVVNETVIVLDYLNKHVLP